MKLSEEWWQGFWERTKGNCGELPRTVHFTEDDWNTIVAVGKERHAVDVARGAKDRRIDPNRSSEDINVIGIIGEFAVAAVLGRSINCLVEKDWCPDYIGSDVLDVEAKSCEDKPRNVSLLVPEWQRTRPGVQNKRFVKVSIDLTERKATLNGWCYGHEIITPDNLNKNLRYPAYMVHQDKLRKEPLCAS